MSLSAIFTPPELKRLREAALRPSLASVGETEVRERGLILFGLGQHGRTLLELLLQADLSPRWLVDNNPALQGASVQGLPVRGVDSLAGAGSSLVLLAGRHAPSMAADCLRLGANWILPAALADFFYSCGELGVTFDELDALPEVEAAYRLLRDDESRLVYKDFIKFQCLFDDALFTHYDPNQYFSNTLKKDIDYSCFIDAGAFDGDTLKLWLQECGQGLYYGFEPQLSEYNKLFNYAQSLNISSPSHIFTFNCGLGDKRGQLKLSLDGISGSFFACSTDKTNINFVDIVRLDDIKLIREPTAIKCDVEGFELNVLNGAIDSITKHTSLIMSIYHKKFDFFKIPLFLNALNNNYKLYIRQHYESYGDTVCYAIP